VDPTKPYDGYCCAGIETTNPGYMVVDEYCMTLKDAQNCVKPGPANQVCLWKPSTSTPVKPTGDYCSWNVPAGVTPTTESDPCYRSTTAVTCNVIAECQWKNDTTPVDPVDPTNPVT